MKLITTMMLAVTLAAGAPPDAPIADAAQRGDLEGVRSLVRSGADVNAAQGDGMTALHWSAERGDPELARVLVFAGANVEAGTRIGRYTPLHLAARQARTEVASILLEAGANPMARTTNSGVTPLHLAAASGDARTLSAMLERGADPNAVEGAWGQTPLTFAASQNRAEAIRVLVAAGADPNMSSRSVDTEEWAEADQAAAERLTAVLEDFRKREGGGSNWTPSPSQVQAAIEISREVQRRWPDIPEYEEEPAEEEEGEEAEAPAGQEPAAQEPTEAQEPVEEAGEPSEEEGEEPSDEERSLSYPEQVDEWGGLTPLLHAVRQGHVEATLTLLESGADINQTSADLTSPLLMATLNGQWDLAKLLIERGADPNQASIAGATPLYAVLERQWEPRASYSHPVEHLKQQTTHIQMLEALLEAGADPNVRLNRHLWYMEYTFSVLGGSGIYVKGATPFWRAAYALDVDAMRLLMEHGADPDVPTMKAPERRRRAADDPPGEEVDGEPELDPSGLPPVPTNGPNIYPIHAASGVGYGQSFAGNAHRYVPDGWMAAVRFLVEEVGADVNVRDASGYTALHHAAARGDNEMIRFLVDHGADVTVVSREGQTTADMANGPIQRVQPYPATIALLEQLGSKNNHNCLSC